MKVNGIDQIEKFSKKHIQAKKPLAIWLQKTRRALWKSFADVKATFGTVDNPKGKIYIFDIGGNKYRLMALVVIQNGTVIIKKIMTHEEYSKYQIT